MVEGPYPVNRRRSALPVKDELIAALDLISEDLQKDFLSHIRGTGVLPRPRTFSWMRIQCYHCGEVFITKEGADFHFGPRKHENQWERPVCQAP